MRASFPPRAEAGIRSGVRVRRASSVERLLLRIGADPQFVEAVLGDLAEEQETRRATDGARAARWWYVREALRSTPHLVGSAVGRASWHRRAELATGLVGFAFAVTFGVTTLFGSATPARLVTSGGTGDEIVVNNDVRPVKLGMRVLDARGHVLPDTGVRFHRMSGARIPVTPRGVVTCSRSGDAIVRASLGALATELVLHCRPVHRVRAEWTLNLVVGAPAVPLPFLAVDADGKPVSLLRGEIGVEDTSVAAVQVGADGTRLVRARAPGITVLDIRIGDRGAGTGVHVFARASTPEGIRAGEHRAIPVTLASGEMIQWSLPAARETYYLSILPDGDDEHVPRMAIMNANCSPDMDGHSFYCVALHGASVFVYHSRESNQRGAVQGMLAVWRQGWH
jgi:hypothetical protein